MPFLSTSLNTGTTKPLGVSTATPILMYFLRIKLSPSSDSDELNVGNSASTLAAAFITNTSGVILTPSFFFSLKTFCSLRNTSRLVISASSNCVTCGICTQLRCKFLPDSFWMRDSFFSSISPNLAKSTFGQGIKPSSLPPALPADAET